ncbi:MAG TPA: DNA primase [Candidatus Paceibacterota bacterium]|nr:DNA primase [Candidatus Paceibacterota bacterium]
MAGTPIEQIKEKLDIVDTLRGYLPLVQAGKNFKAPCPFHKEKTPSFMVSPERQSWHCFGCNQGGDVISFVQKFENLEFGEALRVLAEKAGVELRRMNPAEYKVAGLLYDINEAAKNFYVTQLTSASAVKKYLTDRGLKNETSEEFELGWAPNEPETLNRFLMKTGFAPEDIVRAGVAFKTERGMQLDRFRGRIMFPIHNHLGKVVGFTGRILPQFDTGEMGKYVNSPETPIFNKSKLLYGFWKSKNFIREAGAAFLVEGQMDFLMSWQVGVKHAAASSGTAFTTDHLRTLKRLTDDLIVSFDNDEAGRQAAERAIELAEASDFAVRVVQFHKYKDPADAAQAGPEVLAAAIKAAMPAPEFYFEKYLPAGLGDQRDRSYLKQLRAVLAKLKNISSPVDRSFWLRELSKRVGIDEKTLVEEADRLAAPTTPAAAPIVEAPAAPPAPRTRWDLLSERLVAAAVARSDFESCTPHVQYLTADYRDLFERFARGERRSKDTDLDAAMNLIELRAEPVSDNELADIQRHLQAEYIRDRRRHLTAVVKQAERLGDESAVRKAMNELQALPVL